LGTAGITRKRQKKAGSSKRLPRDQEKYSAAIQRDGHSNRLTRRLDETNLNRGKDMSVGIIGCDGLMKGLCEWPSGDKDSFVGELPRIVHSTVGFKMSTNNRELSSSTVDQQ